MPKLTDLNKLSERVLEVQIGEESLTITYLPHSFTPAELDELQQTEKDGKPWNGTAEILSQLMIDWDLLDDAGNVIEPTYDNLRDIPTEILNVVLGALNADNTERIEARKNLGAGSKGRAKKIIARQSGTIRR